MSLVFLKFIIEEQVTYVQTIFKANRQDQSHFESNCAPDEKIFAKSLKPNRLAD